MPLRHTFIADCETPVSAYLKLRGDGPSFLLESAEQGQRVGRWSFLGFRPRSVIRLDGGGSPSTARSARDDPVRAPSPRSSRATASRRSTACRRSPAARSACSATTSCARAEPTVGAPNPDDTGMPDLALMVTDVLVAFDHLRHEVTVLANVVAERRRGARLRARRPRRSPTCASGCAAPVPRAHAGRARAAGVRVEPRRGRLRRARSSARRSTSARATPTRSCRASAGARTARSRRSRSTAACARSTRAPTCTSSTSRTSRSRAPRPSRSCKVTGPPRRAAADRRHPPARRTRRGGHASAAASCSPTRRSAPST